jgi:peptidoglycan/xylan/chitin deacetylase (PgdA/CDA1 family)
VPEPGARHAPIPFALSTEREPLPPLDGKRLVVHVAVNVEQWAFDAPMPRAVLPPPHGASAVPDVPNFSWAEYGLRCGLPRIMRILEARGLPATAMLNAGVIDTYPSAAESMLAAGWELMGHGMRQRSLTAEPDEAAVIGACLDRIEAFSGRRPKGWLGPGLQETFATAGILKAAGVEYVCDWVVDDVPVWLDTPNGPLVALPYTLELNDSVLHAVEHQPSASLYDRVLDTLAAFEPELEREPRVLTLALHPHLMGVPHRSVHLARALDVLLARDDVVFVTGERIADWFTRSAPD